jgi:hypothetical protein
MSTSTALVPTTHTDVPPSVVDVEMADAPSQEEFAALPVSEQDRITELLPWMRKMREATKKLALAKAMHEALPALSLSRCRSLYDAWTREGWTALVDKNRCREHAVHAAEAVEHPEEFLEWLTGLIMANQRKTAPAIRKLHRMLWKGDPIPGYGTWREVMPDAKAAAKCPRIIPRGWSATSLLRALDIRKAELAMARQGSAAARARLPHIVGTRDGVRCLEFVQFDDLQSDQRVIVAGIRQTVRPMLFTSADVASAMVPVWGARPERPRDDGTRERLCERDVLWLIGMLLERYGYPVEYDMHLCVENGTATIRAADAAALYELSGGRIKVCYGGMQGELILAHTERAVGNFRSKALLESTHNLFHNEMADMKGQIGRNRDTAPQALMKMEQEAVALAEVGTLLSPEQRAALDLPFATWAEWHEYALQVWDRINTRTAHKCEGFARITQWRLKGATTNWLPETALAAMRANGMKLPDEWLEFSARPESPRERFDRLYAAERWQRIPAAILPRFYADCHVLVKVQKGYEVSFQKDGRVYRYLPASPEQSIPEGTELLGTHAPDHMDVLHLSTLTSDGKPGRYVATWERLRPVRRGDPDGLADAHKRVHSFYQSALGNVRKANAATITERIAAEKRNLDLLAEAGLMGVPGTGTDLVESPVAKEPDASVVIPTSAILPPAPAGSCDITNSQRRDSYDRADHQRDAEHTPSRPTLSQAEAITAAETAARNRVSARLAKRENARTTREQALKALLG